MNNLLSLTMLKQPFPSMEFASQILNLNRQRKKISVLKMLKKGGRQFLMISVAHTQVDPQVVQARQCVKM